jgi:hypothetical protein
VQETPQVVLGERDHEVQAFPPQRAQEPLAERVGLRTPHRCFQDPEPQVPHLLIQRLGEDAVSVMDEEAVAVVNRDGFTQLLKGPCRGGMRGHIDVEDFTARVFHHHEHKEEAKGGCDHHAEVAHDDRLHMVADKGPPALGRNAVRPTAVQGCGQVSAHRPRRHTQAELEAQFVGDATRSTSPVAP